MGKFLRNKRGFTLVEILGSLTIFTLIAIPMMSFFIQASQYTTDSQNKTIAINIARNAMSYLEKQNFRVMKTYVGLDASKPYATLNWTNCVIDETCITDSSCTESSIRIDQDDPSLSEICTTGDEDCTPMFYNGDFTDGTICLAVLRPEINNVIYDENDITIYLTRYYPTTSIAHILASDPPDLDNKINEALDGLTASFDDQLLKLYVVVNWHEKREKIVLEGVISDETLR